MDDLSLENKYRIIEKAYNETLAKYGNKQADYALNCLINNNNVEYFTGKENRALLSKYVIYGDIMQVLSLSSNENINRILNDSTELTETHKIR